MPDKPSGMPVGGITGRGTFSTWSTVTRASYHRPNAKAWSSAWRDVSSKSIGQRIRLIAAMAQPVSSKLCKDSARHKAQRREQAQRRCWPVDEAFAHITHRLGDAVIVAVDRGDEV